MEKSKKFKVKLNNLDKIEALLQETYDLACQQHNQIQNEINKIAKTTEVNNLDIDGKEKYAKAINNFIALQQKSTAQKIDIAKLMSEVAKHNGNIDEALKEAKMKNTTLDLKQLRALAKDASTTITDTQTYQVNS